MLVSGRWDNFGPRSITNSISLRLFVLFPRNTGDGRSLKAAVIEPRLPDINPGAIVPWKGGHIGQIEHRTVVSLHCSPHGGIPYNGSPALVLHHCPDKRSSELVLQLCLPPQVLDLAPIIHYCFLVCLYYLQGITQIELAYWLTRQDLQDELYYIFCSYFFTQALHPPE